MIKKPSASKDFVILFPNGKQILPEEYSGKDEDFQSLLDKEVFKKISKAAKAPMHLKIMKDLELVGVEDLSDRGHLRFYPKGALILDLLADYLLDQMLKENAHPVKSSIMYSVSAEPVKQHAKLFGERLYKLKVQKKEYILRYAACFGQFSILKDALISYRCLPLKIFELADSYRLEQSGEVSGLFRQRRFHMGDLHVLCKDLESAKQEFLRLFIKAYRIAEDFGWSYVAMFNICRSFYNQNRDFILKLVKASQKPVLLNLGIPEGKYYWVINIDLDFIDNLKRPVESVGMQIDLGNAKRFGIKFIDENGKRRYPVIIHAALMGSLERWINNLLENAVKQQKLGKLPSLPLWLSPIQVRILPIAERHLSMALKVVEELENLKVRADIDDREISLRRKIRNARKEWVPIYAVIGDEEVKSKKLSVSIRGSKEYLHSKMSIEELANFIHEKCAGKPFRKSYVHKRLSMRPVFVS